MNRKIRTENKNSLVVDLFIRENRIYVLDINNGIVVFNLNGEFIKNITGKPVEEYKKKNILDEGIIYDKSKILGELKNPKAIYVGATYIYVADTENNRVEILDLEGNGVRDFGYRGLVPGTFITPEGITKSGEKIIVSDSSTHRVSIFDEHGIFEKYMAHEDLSIENKVYLKAPEDIFTDENGNTYVLDTGNERVQVFDAEYNLILLFGEKGDGNTQFNGIKDIWVTDKNIYIADSNNKSIKIFDKTENINFVRKIGRNKMLNKIFYISGVIFILWIIVTFIFIANRKNKKEKIDGKQGDRSI